MKASFGRRLGSALIDSILCRLFTGILSVIFILVFLASAAPETAAALPKQSGTAEIIAVLMNMPLKLRLLFSLCILTPSFYYSTEILFGVSLGKKLLGLEIRNDDGSFLDNTRASIRWAFKCFPSFLPVIGLLLLNPSMLKLDTPMTVLLFIGWFLILLPGQSALHDRLSLTAVYPNDVPYTVIEQPKPNDFGKISRA